MRYFAILSFLLLVGCASSLPWPQSPLYGFDQTTSPALSQLSKTEIQQALVGHYAHYDVVAYEETQKRKPMRTFIVSYGFTDFFIEDDQLIERDRFCHAEQKISFKTVTSAFNDNATQAIVPKDKVVNLEWRNGAWQIYRAPTPTLLGIEGNALEPLSRNRDDPNIVDADGDGNPGVTVDLLIGGWIKGQIYLTRREVFENFITVIDQNLLVGHVRDRSEQFILGASLGILDKAADPAQIPDPGLNPLVLTRIDAGIDTCDELMGMRDTLFPTSPSFY